MSVVESLKKSGVDLNTVRHNTLFDACVECRDLRAAEDWMEQIKAAGMADVVTELQLGKETVGIDASTCRESSRQTD